MIVRFIQFIISPFRNFMYHTLKKIVEQHGTASMIRTRKFNHFIFQFIFLRIFYLLYVLITNNGYDLVYQFDYLLIFVKMNPQYDYFLLIAGCLMCIFIYVLIQDFYKDDLDIRTWKIFYMLIVNTYDSYVNCRRSENEIQLIYQYKYAIEYGRIMSNFKLISFLPYFHSLYCKVKVRFLIWHNMDHIHKDKLANYNIPIEFDYPLALRIRIIKLNIFLDYFFTYYCFWGSMF